MIEPRNRVVQVRSFGDPETLEVVDAPLPSAGLGEVRVRVLASSLNYTEVLIRRHLYPQTMRLRPPFVMGYDVVGEIDQLGEGVRNLQIGNRVADMMWPRAITSTELLIASIAVARVSRKSTIQAWAEPLASGTTPTVLLVLLIASSPRERAIPQDLEPSAPQMLAPAAPPLHRQTSPVRAGREGHSLDQDGS